MSSVARVKGNWRSLWDEPMAAGIPIRDRDVDYYRWCGNPACVDLPYFKRTYCIRPTGPACEQTHSGGHSHT